MLLYPYPGGLVVPQGFGARGCTRGSSTPRLPCSKLESRKDIAPKSRRFHDSPSAIVHFRHRRLWGLEWDHTPAVGRAHPQC